MKTLLAILFVSSLAAAAHAQPGQTADAEPLPPPPAYTAPTPAYVAPAPAPVDAEPTRTAAIESPNQVDKDTGDGGWQRPAGKRLLHGFRIGYNIVMNYDQPTRDDGMSIKEEFDLKTPHSMLLGYEAFYRIIGHSWLNVLIVGNVTVAGLEQSKFIPAASGLIGAEFHQSFQLGVGVNVTPDPQAPAHMIAAVGWTPRVGSIHTPIHFYFIPDPASNHRMGATVGVTW